MFDGVDQSVSLTFVSPVQLTAWAAHVRPHIEKMADGSGGRYLATDILAAIAAGRMQLWVIMAGAAVMCVFVTEVIVYPRKRALRFVGLVGNSPRKWRHLVAAVEASARRDFGCDMMEAVHLPRFATLLPGYRMTHWLSEKPL